MNILSLCSCVKLLKLIYMLQSSHCIIETGSRADLTEEEMMTLLTQTRSSTMFRCLTLPCLVLSYFALHCPLAVPCPCPLPLPLPLPLPCLVLSSPVPSWPPFPLPHMFSLLLCFILSDLQFVWFWTVEQRAKSWKLLMLLQDKSVHFTWYFSLRHHIILIALFWQSRLLWDIYLAAQRYNPYLWATN